MIQLAHEEIIITEKKKCFFFMAIVTNHGFLCAALRLVLRGWFNTSARRLSVFRRIVLAHAVVVVLISATDEDNKVLL